MAMIILRYYKIQNYLLIGLILLITAKCEREKLTATFFQYDRLQLTLIFNNNEKLEQFMLSRPSNKESKDAAVSNFDSLAIPLVGAFNVKFNSSAEVIEKIMGDSKTYYYINLDTCIITRLGYSFVDNSFIDFTLINDSLVSISINVKWAELPKSIRIASTKDTILILYGKPNNAGRMETTIYDSELLNRLNIDFLTKSVKQQYMYFYYDSLKLTLNLDKNGRLDEWVLHRPFLRAIKPANTTNFDSLAIPLLGAFGVKFNSSWKDIIKILGVPKSYCFINMDSFTLTSLGWMFNDSSYISFSLKNDSLERISSNVKWAKLPKGIRSGTPKDTIVWLYGKPSFISTTKIKSSYKPLRL